MTELIGLSLFPAALALLGFSAKDKLVSLWWRIARLVEDHAGRAATSDISPREVRWLCRLGLFLTYLAGTTSEIQEILFTRVLPSPAVVAIRNRTPGARRGPMRRVFGAWYLHLMFGKPAGLILLAVGTSLVAYVSALTSYIVGPEPLVAVGQLSPILVLSALVMAVTGIKDKTITTEPGARQGMLRLAVFIAGCFALATAVTMSGWAEGASGARILGMVALSLTTIGAWSPRAWWTSDGWRRWALPVGFIGGAAIAFVATFWEAATADPGFAVALLIANLAASATLLTSALILCAAVRNLPDVDAANLPLN